MAVYRTPIGTDQATEYLALEQADHPVAVPRRERVTHHEQPRLKWNDYAGAPPRRTVKHRCRGQ